MALTTLPYLFVRQYLRLHPCLQFMVRSRVKIFNSDPLSMDDLLKRSESEPCRPKADTRTIAVGRIPTTEYNLLYEVDVRPWDLTRYLRYSGDSVKKLLSDILSILFCRFIVSITKFTNPQNYTFNSIL